MTIEQFASEVENREGMWTAYGSFNEVCSLLDGYDYGSGEQVLKDFRQWLIQRTSASPNLSWPALVSLESRGTEVTRIHSTEENEAVNKDLFRLLREFFAQSKEDANK